MAVTQKADGSSKKPVEEPVQHCGGQGANAGRCGLTQKRTFDGPSTRPEGIRKDDSGVVKSRKRKGNIPKFYESDRLSDIDDIEIIGYMCSKEETTIKRILWEAANEKYIKAKKQKQAASVKKTTKTTKKVEPEKRSSRINYDALNSLVGDSGSSESAEKPQVDPYAHGPQNSADGNISPRMHESNESWFEDDEEDECDIRHGNNETFEDHDEETYYHSEDEDYCNDFD